MAAANLLFPRYDPRKDKVQLYLQRFDFQCKAVELEGSKKANLLLSSLDSETFEKVQVRV